MLLICDSSFTPMQLMSVVRPTMINPSSRPFLAKPGSRKVGKFSSGHVSEPTGLHLMIWNEVEICGRITCQPTATAGTVTICAQR